jgi:hypothetical protein
MILLSNTLVTVSSSYNAVRTETSYGGFVQGWRPQSGWVWGSWNGIESGFVDDEELDGLRDSRCTPPTVRLKTLAPGNPQLPVIDLAATSDDASVPAHWHGMFAKLLYASVFVKLVNQAHGGTETNHKRLRVRAWHRGFRICNILQAPFRSGRQRVLILLQVEPRDRIPSGAVQNLGGFLPKFDISTGRIREEEVGLTNPDPGTVMSFLQPCSS